MEYDVVFRIFFEAESQNDAEEKGVKIWNHIRSCDDVIDSEPERPPTPTGIENEQ